MRRHFIYLAYGCYLMHMWTQGQLTVIPMLDRAAKLWDTELGDSGKSKEPGQGQMQGQRLKVKSWRQVRVISYVVLLL